MRRLPLGQPILRSVLALLLVRGSTMGARSLLHLANEQHRSPRKRLRCFSFGVGLAMAVLGCSQSSQPGAETQAARSRLEDLAIQIREPYRIEVTGSEYEWHVRYPGTSGLRAVQNIHCPVQTRVMLVLNSTDYVYTLGIPHFGVKEIAVPDLEFQREFRTSSAGEFELDGDELCGLPHPQLKGLLIVEPQEQFVRWLAEGF